MSGAPAAPVAESPAPFPRRGWLALGASAALGLAALVLSRLSQALPSLLTSAGLVAVGFALARYGYGLARQAHARGPLAICGLLLGFLAIPLIGAMFLGLLFAVRPR